MCYVHIDTRGTYNLTHPLDDDGESGSEVGAVEQVERQLDRLNALIAAPPVTLGHALVVAVDLDLRLL